jgi:hypothetical protein
LPKAQDWYGYTYETARCKRGHEGILLYPRGGNLRQSKTYDLGLTFVKACSDLCAIHQRKYKEWQKGGSLVTDG